MTKQETITKGFGFQVPGVSWWNDVALRDHVFPELQWLIPDELPVGYTVILGAPKTGKTALILPLAHRLAKSGMRVLYLKMDDSLRRMRGRTIMANPKPAELEGPYGFAELWYVDGWRPRTAAEAFGQLDFWLNVSKQQGKQFDAIMVDTYGRFVGRRPPGDVFGFDYEMGERFKVLCERYECSIMATHHTRKGAGAEEDWLDVVSGSAGITAAADAIWYITRTRGGRDGVLRIAGNDMEEIERAVILGSDMVWRFNETLSPAQARHSGTPRAVLDFLMVEAEATTGEIVEQTLASANNVHVSLQRLQNEGLVSCKRDGKRMIWSLTLVADNRVGSEPVPEPAATTFDAAQDTRSVSAAVGSPELPRPVPSIPAAAPIQGEAAPLLAGSSRATSKMMELVGDSRLHAAFHLAPEIKELIPYDVMCLGGKSNQWTLFPHRCPEGLVFRFDRRAAYWQSSPWLTPNILTRRGPMTYEEVQRERLAGVFQIATTPWRDRNLPSPYGAEAPRAREFVTRPTLNRLFQLARANMIEMPRILMSLSGRGSERLLDSWMDWCLAERRAHRDDPEMLKLVKADQNLAIGNLRIVTNRPDGTPKSPGPIDRWDWQYAIISQHYAMMNLYAIRSLTAAEPLIAMGNTDELVYVMPEGTPETWVPKTLEKLFEKNAIGLKGVEPAAGWFERGGKGERV